MTHAPNAIATRIIDQLDNEGLSWEDYQLYNMVDPDALEHLLDPKYSGVEVTFTVHDYQVTVTGPDSIQIDQLPTQ